MLRGIGSGKERLGYSEDTECEVTRFWKEESRTIILLAAKELLDGNSAYRLV